MGVPEVPRVPLIEELTTDPIPAGSNLLVEYDAASQWYVVSVAMAGEWLRQRGSVLYATLAQQPQKIRSQLNRLSLDVEDLEKDDKLRIWDWYTCTLGLKSKEKYAVDSLKVQDLSIGFSQSEMRSPPAPDLLRIFDSSSTVARFNDEKSFVELILTRGIPVASLRTATTIRGLMRGLHSEWVYKQLEAGSDSVIDFKLEEGEVTKNLIRIRIMREVGFDSRWHPIQIGKNFEVTLNK